MDRITKKAVDGANKFVSPVAYFLLAFILVLISQAAEASGMWELSTGFWFNRSRFSEENFTWTRRIGVGVSYHFSQLSGVEFNYQDSRSRTKVVDGPTGFVFQDTTFSDKVYSLSWVQHIFGNREMFQPFFKAGLAQLNRDIEGMFYNTPSRVQSEDSLTIVFSLGFRILFTQTMAFRAEATTYLTEGGIKTWEDNLAGTAGFSLFF